MTPFPLSGSADALLDALRDHCPASRLDGISGHQLMAERSLLAGHEFTPGVSPGGSCRILPTRTCAIAINLPRDSDWELIPAWLATDEATLAAPGNWNSLAAAIAAIEADSLVQRGHQLGLAVAATGNRLIPRHVFAPTAPLTAVDHARKAPLVVDLSALWAGPLASHLLWLCGADIIKVESLTRPDGGRDGNQPFYRLLNQGKRSVALALHEAAGRRQLHELLSAADIVIESSRPRALRQLGISAEDLITAKPDITWISITSYGREEPAANWIAYGDDAAIAAGMADLMFEACGSFEFAGDAIADPLTGIDAALAAIHGWQTGGLGLVSIALAHVVAWAIGDEINRIGKPAMLANLSAWWQQIRNQGPKAGSRQVTARVAALGEDTNAVLTGMGIQCC